MENIIDDLLLRLEPEFGKKKIDSLKLLYRIGDEERKERILKIASLSAKKLINDNLLNNQVLLPPSTKQECEGKKEICVGDICYGTDVEGKDKNRYPLFLDFSDIGNHILITGLTGSGKTTLSTNLTIELAKKNTRGIIFDWNRSWRNILTLDKEKYPFIDDIRVFTIGRNDIAPFSYNFFFFPPPAVKFSNWLGIVTGKPLQKSLFSGQGVSDFLENIGEELMESYQKGIRKLLPNIEDIKIKLQSKFSTARQLLWKQSAERILKELCRESMKEVFGSRNPIDISKEILERDGITIIEMDLETPDHLRILFQELLLNYILLYYLHQGEKEHLETVIILEEFPSMLPQSSIEHKTGGEVIKKLFRESRKFGLGLIAIAQESSELPNFVTANCKVQFNFAAQTKKDIEATAGSMFLKKHEIPFLDYIWQGECFAKVKGRVKNCLVKIPASPINGKITDEELKEKMTKWKNQS
jgi:hypothetical protein